MKPAGYFVKRNEEDKDMTMEELRNALEEGNKVSGRGSLTLAEKSEGRYSGNTLKGWNCQT